MKLLIFSCLVVAACSHDAAPAHPTNATAAADTDPPVDPTLPSWAPRSCSGYHAAVVNFLACEAVSKETRDVVRTKYDLDQAKWQAMENQPQGAIDGVRQSCSEDWHSVKMQMEGKCR
jgi:hypothetical protein